MLKGDCTMKLNPESKTISEIFPIEPQAKYRVPIYQRNYSWMDGNIEEFFEDIRNEPEGYYIGNLLVTEAKQADGVKIFDVVDGQQRLTTIALFLLAIYERLADLKNFEAEDSVNSSTYDRIIRLQGDLERKLLINYEDPHIVLLDKDREIFENYLGVINNGPRGRYGNRVFGKRYKSIQGLMEQLENFDEVNIFYRKLNSLELLRITVENISDAFSVFSSLNAKGLPLTLIDLLKSTYLGRATQEDVFEEDALEKWEQLIEIFLDKNDEPHSTAITQFFLNNWDAFVNNTLSSITKKSALKKYQKLFNDKGYSYIDELIENAKLYSIISPLVENHDDHPLVRNLEKLFNKLMKLESSQSYPLQLFLLKKYHENKLSVNNLEKSLEYIVNYFVRRNIVLKPKSSNIRAKILSSIRILQKEDDLNNVVIKIIKQEMNSISSTEIDFKNALQGSVYDVSPKTVRMILIDLEREYGKFFDKQKRDNLDEYVNNRPIWTLEHILPKTQNLKYGWPAMISPDDLDEATQLQQRNVHKIGNLTLTGYNSEMSDKKFLEKRDFSSDNGYSYQGLRTKLFLNDSLTEDGQELGSKDSWTIEDIERRTEYFSDLIIKLYPLD